MRIKQEKGGRLFDDRGNDPKVYLDSWNLLEELDLGDFSKGIEELEEHILKTIETPIEQREKVE